MRLGLSSAPVQPGSFSSSSELVVRLVVVVFVIIRATAAARTLVVLLDDRGADALDLLLLLLDLLRVGLRVARQPVLPVLDGIVDGLLLVLVHLLPEALVVAGSLDRGLHGVDVSVESVARIDALLRQLVLLRELLRFPDHLLDLLLGQAALVVRDRDLLRCARALVLGADVEDTVRVDLESDLNLRLTARRRRNSGHVELAELVVVLRHRPLALEDLDGHRRLVVLVRREDLALLGRDHGVTRDQLGHDAANGLDPERQRGHVEEEEVGATLTGEDAGLDRSAVRNGLVRVDSAVGLLAVEEVLDERLHLRDARRAADQDDLVDLRLLQTGVIHHVLDRAERLLEEVAAELLEARASQGLGEVLAIEESLDLEPGLVRRRESALRLLDFLAQLLQRTLVLRHVLASLLVEDFDEVLHDALVEVLASQVRVAVRRHNLEDPVVDREQRHVECAAAEVVDEDVLLRLLVETVRDGRGGRLVDNPKDLKAGDRSGVLRRLALRVVEVRRHGDDGVLHLLAKVVLSRLLHLGEHHRRDVFRHELLRLALHLHRDHRLAALVDNVEREELLVALHRLLIVLAADQALHVEQRLGGVDRRLRLSGLANETLVLGERDVRRGDAVALVIRNNLNATVLVDPNARVGRAKIDPNDGAINFVFGHGQAEEEKDSAHSGDGEGGSYSAGA